MSPSLLLCHSSSQTLPAGFDPLRNQVYARYVAYFQNRFQSAIKEVLHLVGIVAREAKSVTWKKLSLIKEVLGLSPWDLLSEG